MAKYKPQKGKILFDQETNHTSEMLVCRSFWAYFVATGIRSETLTLCYHHRSSPAMAEEVQEKTALSLNLHHRKDVFPFGPSFIQGTVVKRFHLLCEMFSQVLGSRGMLSTQNDISKVFIKAKLGFVSPFLHRSTNYCVVLKNYANIATKSCVVP